MRGAGGHFSEDPVLVGAGDIAEWHIVSINSNIGAFAGSPQERWLRADLAANRTQCTLAYPLATTGWR